MASKPRPHNQGGPPTPNKPLPLPPRPVAPQATVTETPLPKYTPHNSPKRRA
jgi:hypothetical protein